MNGWIVMFEVVALPAFSDNYLWLLFSDGRAVVVDPGDARVVERALTERALALDGILLTHHHADHTGGVAALAAAHACPVYGPAREDIAGVTRAVADADRLAVLGAWFEVIEVPGHTRGHIAYWCEPARSVFCGDTLFAGGCGRLFEGSPQQMWESLNRLAALPGDTRVYCAHEYTRANLRFARHVEPDNPALERRSLAVDALRAAGLPTVPSTVAEERATNPFLRCTEPGIVRRAATLGAAPRVARRVAAWPGMTGPARILAILRAAKDDYA